MIIPQGWGNRNIKSMFSHCMLSDRLLFDNEELKVNIINPKATMKKLSEGKLQ